MEDVFALFKYPLISGTKGDYRGFISVQGNDVEISTETRKKSLLVNLPRYKQQEIEVNRYLTQVRVSDITDCLDYVGIVLSPTLRLRQTFVRTDLYRLVLNEFSELCDIYVSLERCSVSPDLGEVTVVTSDSCGRRHELVVGVDYSKAGCEIFYVKRRDLPRGAMEERAGSLKVICERFLQVVRNLQMFWNILDEFDKSFRILDPEKPRKMDVHRRIALGDSTSVIVTFDPFNVKNVPDLKFLGPERHLEKFRENLVDNLEKWDRDGDVLREFLKLLGVKSLPKKLTETTDADLLYEQGECCICFCSRWEDKLPEIVCSNPSCEKSFHTCCLYEYLVSSISRKCFNEIRGNCPNCEKSISCPIP